MNFINLFLKCMKHSFVQFEDAYVELSQLLLGIVLIENNSHAALITGSRVILMSSQGDSLSSTE